MAPVRRSVRWAAARWRGFPLPLRVEILLLFFWLGLGTLGFHLLEGWTWGDSFFVTILVLTTLGFAGDFVPASGVAKGFSIALILLGVATISAILGTLGHMILEAQLAGPLRRRRMIRRLEAVTDHLILCGYGRVGRQVARELQIHPDAPPLVVIDLDRTAAEDAAADGYLSLAGDATEDEVLRRAGIERARGLIAAAGDDAQNVFIVLSARALNPDLWIVARATREETGAKLLRAGANRVLSPHTLGGRRLAHMALHPVLTDFLDLVTHSEELEFWLEEIRLSEGSPLVGRTLAEADLRQRCGVMILAIRKGETILTNPAPETLLEAGDLLIALGTREQLQALEALG